MSRPRASIVSADLPRAGGVVGDRAVAHHIAFHYISCHLGLMTESPRRRTVALPSPVPAGVARPALRLVERDPADRVGADEARAVAILVVEHATGARLDPNEPWDRSDLEAIGCSPELAADLAAVLRPTAGDGAPPIGFDPHRLAPPVTIPSVAIEGLGPIGEPTAVDHYAAPPGWRRWVATGLGRMRVGLANRAHPTTHGPGRGNDRPSPHRRRGGADPDR